MTSPEKTTVSTNISPQPYWHHTVAEGAKPFWQTRLATELAKIELLGATGEPLGHMSVAAPATANTQVVLYDSKGGPLVLLRLENGLVAFVLPGGSLQLPCGWQVSLAQQALPAWLGGETCLPPVQTPQTHVKQAMILGAGIGTRILPLTESWMALGKPALPLPATASSVQYQQTQTVIGLLIEQLAQHGIERVFVNTFYGRASVRQALQQATQRAGIKLVEIPEHRATGTAGGLFTLLNQPEAYPAFNPQAPLMVVQGDAVTNANFSALIEAHQASGAVVTIGSKAVPDSEVSKFGIMTTRSAADLEYTLEVPGIGWITEFLEKPSLAEAGDHRLASTGFYVLSAAVYEQLQAVYALKWADELSDAVAQGKPLPEEVAELDFAKDLFPYLMMMSQTGTVGGLLAYPIAGCWCDIGNPAQYVDVLQRWYEGQLGQPVQGVLAEPLNHYYHNGAVYWQGAYALAQTQKLEAQGAVLLAISAQNLA